MSIPVTPSAADKFRTVTLRVDRNTRVARFDGLQEIHFGDSLIVVVDNVSGIDPDDIQFWVWEKVADPARADALVQAQGFVAVPGYASRAYLNITFNSAKLGTALAATPVGTPLAVRMIVRDGSMPFVDMDINVYPNPEITEYPDPDPGAVLANPFVRRDHLRQWALDAMNPISPGYLPLDTTDDMADAIIAILTKLSDVTAP